MRCSEIVKFWLHEGFLEVWSWGQSFSPSAQSVNSVGYDRDPTASVRALSWKFSWEISSYILERESHLPTECHSTLTLGKSSDVRNPWMGMKKWAAPVGMKQCEPGAVPCSCWAKDLVSKRCENTKSCEKGSSENSNSRWTCDVKTRRAVTEKVLRAAIKGRIMDVQYLRQH